MKPKTLKEHLVKMVQAGRPVLIKGAPGVGKSDIVNQVAKITGYDLILTHPVVSDPTDYKGMPAVLEDRKTGEKTADFLPFGDLHKMITAKNPTIAFLDDLGQAPAVVQAAVMQLILARRVNGHHVSDKVVFIAATNRRQDRAGVTGILEPVKSRFTAIWELQPDKDEWIEWALNHDMPPEIIGFIHFRPEMLAKEEVTSDIVNHPCPRTIANAGELIKLGLSSIEDLAGAIGEGAAAELNGFIKVYQDLPNIDAILMDPMEAIVPKDPSAQYAVTAALINVVTKDNIDRVFKYASRLPADFSMLLIRDAVRKNPKLQATTAFITWCKKHQDFLR